MEKMVKQHNSIKMKLSFKCVKKGPLQNFPSNEGRKIKKTAARRLKRGGINLQPPPPFPSLSSLPPIKLDSCTKEEENSRKNPWLNWRKEEGEGEESIINYHRMEGTIIIG